MAINSLLPFSFFCFFFFFFFVFFLFGTEHVPVGFTSKPQGHWSPKNMRKFLEDFAKHKKLDPLVPETWSNIQSRDIHETKVFSSLLYSLLPLSSSCSFGFLFYFQEGKSVLQKLKGYPRAVVSLFPEIPFEENKLISRMYPLPQKKKKTRTQER